MLQNDLTEAQRRAEALFAKRQRLATEGAQAMAEYQAAARAVAEKTARLKALRMAKEASEPEVSHKAKSRVRTKPR